VNLGPTVNSSSRDRLTSVSSDGLTLLFGSQRPSGYGDSDIWITRRLSVSDDWDPAVNLGPLVNTEYGEDGPSISADGSILYFNSARPNGLGRADLWQVPIIPLFDFNLDGVADALDAIVMMENWGIVGGRGGPETTLCDIAPLPFGDGIVDAKDLLALAEHMIEDTESANNQDDIQ
jgi:hypothetical protein